MVEMGLMFVAKAIIIVTLLSGIASQYSPGVMDSVVRVRQSGKTAMDLPAVLPAVDGFVAMEDCAMVGEIVFIRPKGESHWDSFLVADCSGHSETSAWMERNNILVELGYNAAKRYNTVGYGLEIELMLLEKCAYNIPY